MANGTDLCILAYLRKSRDRREQHDPEVLARHREIIADLMAKNGHAGEVYEEVQSGESIASRPVFQRLLADLSRLPDAGSTAVQGQLYCMDADRLGRGVLTERGQIQDLLVAKGILLCTPSGVTDLRNTDHRLLHNVKGALAEWELGKYKERVARTRSLQIRQGQIRNGSVPYGYFWDLATKQPMPHPTKFPVLQQMIADAFTHSTHELSKKYGVPQQHVHRALTSPMICGWPAKTTKQTILANGTVKISYLPREQWIWPEKEGSYLKAMSRRDWERLQKIIARRRKGSGKAEVDHWCRDVVSFEGSPGPCRLGTYNGWGGKVATYEEPKARMFVERSRVHQTVEQSLRELLSDKEWLLRAVAEGMREDERDDIIKLEEMREGLREEMATQQRYLGRATGERLASIEDVIERIEEDLEAVKRRIALARQEASTLSSDEAARIRAMACRFADDFDLAWPLFRDPEKRLLTRLLIAAAEVKCEKRGRAYHREVVVRPKDWLL